MSERLDYVEVFVARQPDPIRISCEARDELLGRLGPLHAHGSTVGAFRAVGASRPVRLALPEKQALLIVIEDWIVELGDTRRPPAGVWDLRNALIDDLHDAGLGP